MVREGNQVTLIGNAIVFSDNGEGVNQFASDALSRWNNLSYKDEDGLTYRTNISFIQTKDLQQSNVWLRYAAWANGNGGWANPGGNGEVTFGTDILAGLRAGASFAPGDAAHEFGHTFFGLKDAYRRLDAPNGWYQSPTVYKGFEDSLMGNPRTGTVRAADLKKLILHFESMQIKKGRSDNAEEKKFSCVGPFIFTGLRKCYASSTHPGR